MHEIKEIHQIDLKNDICNRILRDLPNWFGDESAILNYIEKTQDMQFWSMFDNGEPIAFIALKDHNQYTAEIYVMGVLEEYHRQGIGRELIETAEEFYIKRNMKYLTLKTLDESRQSDSYERTRKFYLSMGFLPLYWDKDNPCLIMAKYIAKEI